MELHLGNRVAVQEHRVVVGCIRDIQPPRLRQRVRKLLRVMERCRIVHGDVYLELAIPQLHDLRKGISHGRKALFQDALDVCKLLGRDLLPLRGRSVQKDGRLSLQVSAPLHHFHGCEGLHSHGRAAKDAPCAHQNDRCDQHKDDHTA